MAPLVIRTSCASRARVVPAYPLSSSRSVAAWIRMVRVRSLCCCLMPFEVAMEALASSGSGVRRSPGIRLPAGRMVGSLGPGLHEERDAGEDTQDGEEVDRHLEEARGTADHEQRSGDEAEPVDLEPPILPDRLRAE